MEKKKISMSLMLSLFAILPLLLSVICLGSLAIETLSSELKDNAYDKIRLASEDLGKYVEKELKDSDVFVYETNIVDAHISDDIELTVFKENERFATSLKNEEGNRNEGTILDDDIYKSIKRGETYSAENVAIGNTNYFVYYSPIYDSEGNFWGIAFAGIAEDEISKTILESNMQIIVIAFVIAIVVVSLITYFSSRLKKSLQGTVKLISEMSDGNLSYEGEVVSKTKEIQDMIVAASNMQRKLFAVMSDVKKAADELNVSVENVDDLSENSAAGAGQINEAISELANTAQSMAETIQDANTNIIDMGDGIAEITEKVKNMSEDSDKMLTINSETMKYIKVVKEATDKTAGAVENIGKQTKDTNSAVEKIKSAAEIIGNIAAQTNLLSLNASIEAARAGEAGKGFAVVADNIKQLAEQSAVAANSIKQVVSEIVELSEQSVKLSDETIATIDEQQNCIHDTVEKITELNDAVTLIASNVMSVDKDAQKLDEKKVSILGDIGDLSAISEENAASAEEVTASVESITNGIMGTKDQSKLMRDMASKLVGQVSYFH